MRLLHTSHPTTTHTKASIETPITAPTVAFMDEDYCRFRHRPNVELLWDY